MNQRGINFRILKAMGLVWFGMKAKWQAGRARWMTVIRYGQTYWEQWEPGRFKAIRKTGAKVMARVVKGKEIWWVMGLSLVWRLWSINYNSAFADEAIYVVIGKLGVFDWDWWTYNAASWLGGSPYAYPLLTALSYTSGGIVASRLVSVVLGVLTMEGVYVLTNLWAAGKTKARWPGVIAAGLVGFSLPFFQISRLATYDMPAVYFLVLGLVMLSLTERRLAALGKLYLVAAVSLFAGVMMKLVVGLFVPLIVIYSGLMAKKLTKNKHWFFWKRYFLGPLVVLGSLYLLANYPALINFGDLQLGREYIEFSLVTKEILALSWWSGVMLMVGLSYLIYKREWLRAGLLGGGFMMMILFHLSLHREATLDKHMIYPYLFGAISAGVGLAGWLKELKKVGARTLVSGMGAGLMGAYLLGSWLGAAQYNQIWQDTRPVEMAMKEWTQPDDLVLTEEGPPVMLALFQKIRPQRVTTFDWFDYRGESGAAAYGLAVEDGYFNVIELASTTAVAKTEQERQVYEAVTGNLSNAYKKVYQDEIYSIYRRQYE